MKSSCGGFIEGCGRVFGMIPGFPGAVRVPPAGDGRAVIGGTPTAVSVRPPPPDRLRRNPVPVSGAARSLGSMSLAQKINRVVAPFEVISDYVPAGDQQIGRAHV